jgi:hypothetical protein
MKRYYIIHCPLDEVEFGIQLTDALKAKGYYYVMSLVKDMKAISMKQVTEEEFKKEVDGNN